MCHVGGLPRAGAVVVDALSHLALEAHRAGRGLRIEQPSPDLVELIEVMGMSGVLFDRRD